MSDNTAAHDKVEIRSKHYKIRKEIVGLGVVIAVIATTYQIHDYFTHLNWPPHEGRNKEFTKSLNCPIMKFNLTKNDIDSISGIGGFTGNLDRKMFFDNPNCLSASFLYNEGTGIRTKLYIYDRTSKKQTAVIEITHKYFAEGELK